jgi:acetate kinase
MLREDYGLVSMNKIFVVNIGSTSLKFHLFNMAREDVLAKGYLERIGNADSPLSYTMRDQEPIRMTIDTTSGYGIGIKTILERVIAAGLLKDLSEIDGIGFKAVHAGEFRESSLITEEIIARMEDLSCVVPAHNPPYVNAIRQFREWIPAVPLVAAFETDFHRHMPDYAYIYSVPFAWYERYHVRRYGFHGASHRYVSERAAEILRLPKGGAKLITCHLGGSSSVSAIKNGVSIDNSMGFSTQAGMPMSTRSGDIDPFIIPYVMKKEGLSLDEVMEKLVKEGGLKGISGTSGDVRDLEESYSRSYRSRLAFEALCYSVKKTIGSYLAVLGGIDALVFTGGIGENSSRLRQRVCEGLEFLGIELDTDQNSLPKSERVISRETSTIKVMIIPTNEEIIVARETLRVITDRKNRSGGSDE